MEAILALDSWEEQYSQTSEVLLPQIGSDLSRADFANFFAVEQNHAEELVSAYSVVSKVCRLMRAARRRSLISVKAIGRYNFTEFVK